MEGRWKERRQEEGREKELKREGKDEGKGRDGCSTVNCATPIFPLSFHLCNCHNNVIVHMVIYR